MEQLRVLFICTHNRCRSILAEAICNGRGAGLVAAVSAGSHPAGKVHPATLEQLRGRGYPVEGLRSDSWRDYADAGIDVAVTVCDSAAGEACPLWLGHTPRVHWGLPDPSKLPAGVGRDAAFGEVMDWLEARVALILQQELFRLRGPELAEAMQALAGDEYAWAFLNAT